MKIALFDLKKKKMGEKELPAQFSEEFRPDLIKRAVHALQRAARQRYGASPGAGLRHSSKVSKRRRNYRGCYGFGVSRVNRKVLSRRGMRMFWVGAFSPQTRGGHRSHPPKATKIQTQKINKKENQKAIRSAMAAVVNKQIVEKRGHKVPAEYPFIIDSAVEKMDKTAATRKMLMDLGFESELQRSSVKKIRAGIGKMRGRRYQKKKGILIVVGEECPLMKSARNIPGVDIVPASSLNTALLAPGTMPGRATLWTENAINAIKEKKLFI